MIRDGGLLKPESPITLEEFPMGGQFSQQFQQTLEKNLMTLYARVTFGASGAATLARGKGVVSVTKGATGLYDVVVEGYWGGVVSVSAVFDGASTNAPTVQTVSLQTDTVSTDNSLRVGTLGITTGAIAFVEPASGETMFLSIVLSPESL